MLLRLPSRRVTKHVEGISRSSRVRTATRTHIFALALLPRALTLSLNLTPVDRLTSAIAADTNQSTTISTTLAFDATQPMPLKFDASIPKIQKGMSHAEEAAQQTVTVTKVQTVTKAAVTATTTNEPVATPDLDTKRSLVQDIAASHGIDWKLLEAVWQIESGKAWKTSVTSSAGALGPMQFMLGTWRHYGSGDITYAPDALNAGASLLAANGAASGNIDRALLSYNHAQWYVDKVKNIMASI